MSRTQKPDLMTFRAWTPRRLLLLLDHLGGDGHSILDPFPLTEAIGCTAVEACYLGALSRWHESDGTPKGTITDAEGVVDGMFGLYTLDVYQAMASDFEVQYASKFGRGSRAREIARAVREHVEALTREVNGAPAEEMTFAALLKNGRERT